MVSCLTSLRRKASWLESFDKQKHNTSASKQQVWCSTDSGPTQEVLACSKANHRDPQGPYLSIFEIPRRVRITPALELLGPIPEDATCTWKTRGKRMQMWGPQAVHVHVSWVLHLTYLQ